MMPEMPKTPATTIGCPTCKSPDPNTCRSDCYNPWHQGLVVHFQCEPIGTPGDACHAACSVPIDDPPSQLAVGWEFVSCPQCLAIAPAGDRGKRDSGMPTREKIGDAESEFWSELRRATIIRHPQELSDEEVDHASSDDLRAAYRSLRDHYLTETTSLISRRDDLTRRRDDVLAKSHQDLHAALPGEVLAQCQRLMENAGSIMQSDETTIDRLSSENARLAKIGDTAAKVLAARVADPTNSTMPDYLSDNELVTWLDRSGLQRSALEGTYLGLIFAELRERRDAEAMFVDVDLQLQRLVDCPACADDSHGSDDEHRAILKRWRIARAALCALARIHRGYLRSRNAPDGGDPR